MTIEVSGLKKAYGPHPALRGLSFEVKEGETFVLLGPNGAGKTTTIEILEGYRAADGGEVKLLGLDPQRHHRRLRALMGVMLQEGGLYPGLRVEEILRLFASYYPEPRDIASLAARLGLRDLRRRKVRDLSGGEARRLSLALALIGRPRVVFLDEPTGQMDPRARAEAHSIVEDLKGDGVTVLLATHLMEEAESLADRIGIIHRGRMVASGTPSELRGSRRSVSVVTDRDLVAGDLAAALGVPVDVTGRRIVIDADPSPSLIAALAGELASQGALVLDLTSGHRSLSEVYLALTDEDLS